MLICTHFGTFWRLKSLQNCKKGIFRTPAFPKLISSKIWVIDKSWHFHTVSVEHSVEKWEIHSHWKNFRQINYLVTLLVKPFLSRNFCQKTVRVNFRNFHTVYVEETVWKFQDFSVTHQILREIKFWRMQKLYNCSKCVEIADFALLESPKVISSKIWVTKKSWNFHTIETIEFTLTCKKFRETDFKNQLQM